MTNRIAQFLVLTIGVLLLAGCREKASDEIEEISTEKLGGVDFDVMHVSMTLGASTARQKYYASIMKGYALIFVVSFTTADEESALQDILEGVTFKSS